MTPRTIDGPVLVTGAGGCIGAWEVAKLVCGGVPDFRGMGAVDPDRAHSGHHGRGGVCVRDHDRVCVAHLAIGRGPFDREIT